MPNAVRVLVLHGPNLNLLGTREPEIYGGDSLAQIDDALRDAAARLNASVETRQSNHEGVLIDWIQNARSDFDGIIINPGGFAHSSVAIHDAIRASQLPTIEVHLSNVHARESFRRELITAAACIGIVAGFGSRSYLLGFEALIEYLRGTKLA